MIKNRLSQLPIRLARRARRHVIFWRRQRQRRRFFRQFIPRDGLCFDVGANLGDRTDLFLALGARVVAIEPVAETAALLRQRFAGHARLTILETALGAAAGESTITVCTPHQLSTLALDWFAATDASRRFPGRAIVAAQRTPLTTLDHLIDLYGAPDFIKIDVEGYELEVLKGLSQPVPALSIEYTPETLEQAVACTDYLSGLGRIELNYSHGDSLTWALKEWLCAEALFPILRADCEQDVLQFGDIYVRFVQPGAATRAASHCRIKR